MKTNIQSLGNYRSHALRSSLYTNIDKLAKQKVIVCLRTVLFDKSADIEHQWLQNRDLGNAPTEQPAPCGSDAFVAISKPGKISNNKGYRGHIRQDAKQYLRLMYNGERWSVGTTIGDVNNYIPRIGTIGW